MRRAGGFGPPPLLPAVYFAGLDLFSPFTAEDIASTMTPPNIKQVLLASAAVICLSAPVGAGTFNDAEIVQMGIANNSTQFQNGYSNTAAAIQFGAYNDSEIIQIAYHNDADLMQAGYGNTAAIHQGGTWNDAVIAQVGGSNDASISSRPAPTTT